MKSVPQRDICTPTFDAILVTVAQIWKQPKCWHEWMDKETVRLYTCVYIYIYIYTVYKAKYH